MPIEFIPTSTLEVYLLQWEGMFKAGLEATYEFTPPYPYMDIKAELEIRKELESRYGI